MPMSTVHFFKIAATVAFIAFLSTNASAVQLKPFKDELFSSQTIVESHDNGAFETIDYQEMRDINGRDIVPERRVKPAYLGLGVRWKQTDETLALGARKLDVTRVGPATGQAFTVIFVHGRAGDRRLGSNDYMFGGNFNRLKNLVVDNGGSYYAPTIGTFDAEGVADVAALIRAVSEQSGGKPVILSCASMGSIVCWGITRDVESVKRLSGMVMMSAVTDPTFAKSPFYKARLPIWFAHGSADNVYAAADQQAQFEKLIKAKYPARFTLYTNGTHGTPLRMLDWRKTLNWLFLPSP
ncbi:MULTISPECIES: alpha/beta hydrolase family protein [unclassified Rhizobium]|uniref:alpha/beta hydrolase n=1 Tax=unclassified Rhizobium TaxID=2613769 RepID=UPI001ADB7F82|nr:MULTISPECIES: alpha/beta hydrolase [unclassified Rhizobium]MBO9098394.1 alpha/beta hydrolase [Rhizobium sp. L58/93]MBO9132802.1 alpha/beta hydrolase [Rhizobium sp. B209b/85]MBO9168660.1 alpha/beta hydrolase [Rhizobium sp. L245/93]MBO9184610.1 alpha/beta hydrolase [Rhizobium sp. E27B/91]QXZ84790.1 alpha/beta hydrolase [Rhizobium sp. K1/93]